MVHDFIHGQEPSLLSRVTFKLKIRSRGYEKILPSLIKIHETKRLNHEKKKSLNHASCKKYMTLLDNSLYFLTHPSIYFPEYSNIRSLFGIDRNRSEHFRSKVAWSTLFDIFCTSRDGGWIKTKRKLI